MGTWYTVQLDAAAAGLRRGGESCAATAPAGTTTAPARMNMMAQLTAHAQRQRTIKREQCEMALEVAPGTTTSGNEWTDEQVKTFVKGSYRRLRLLWHPDKKNGDAAMFRSVCDAHAWLTDSATRETWARTMEQELRHEAAGAKEDAAKADRDRVAAEAAAAREAEVLALHPVGTVVAVTWPGAGAAAYYVVIGAAADDARDTMTRGFVLSPLVAEVGRETVIVLEFERKVVFDPFPRGSQVLLAGLRNRKDLNGQIATVGEYLPSTGRFVVRVAGLVLSLKPTNLRAYGDAPEMMVSEWGAEAYAADDSRLPRCGSFVGGGGQSPRAQDTCDLTKSDDSGDEFTDLFPSKPDDHYFTDLAARRSDPNRSSSPLFPSPSQPRGQFGPIGSNDYEPFEQFEEFDDEAYTSTTKAGSRVRFPRALSSCPQSALRRITFTATFRWRPRTSRPWCTSLVAEL